MNILVCGDSHTRVFKHCNLKQFEFIFDVCEVGGATAQGAVNPNSKTDALNIFFAKINNTNADKLMIMLGEVDCGFLIWVRSKRHNINIDEQLNNSVNNLFQFLNDVKTNKNYKSEDIIILGAPLPTIKDSTDKKFLNGARSEVDVSQLTRTIKTIEYNNLLKNKCNEYGYKYIDITNYIISDDGIVSDKYLNDNPNDHHLDNEKTYNFWITKLKDIL